MTIWRDNKGNPIKRVDRGTHRVIERQPYELDITHGVVSIEKAVLKEIRFYAETFGMTLEEYVLENHRLVKQVTQQMYGSMRALRREPDTTHWQDVVEAAHRGGARDA